MRDCSFTTRALLFPGTWAKCWRSISGFWFPAVLLRRIWGGGFGAWGAERVKGRLAVRLCVCSGLFLQHNLELERRGLAAGGWLLPCSSPQLLRPGQLMPAGGGTWSCSAFTVLNSFPLETLYEHLGEPDLQRRSELKSVRAALQHTDGRGCAGLFCLCSVPASPQTACHAKQHEKSQQISDLMCLRCWV